MGVNHAFVAAFALLFLGNALRDLAADMAPPDPVIAELQAENTKLQRELEHATNKLASQKDTIDTLVIDVRTNKQAKEAMQSAFVECQKIVARKRLY